MILQNGKRIDGCSDTVPVGTLQPYLGLVPPKGYLVCQGQLVSKITYSKLYEICGDTFGTSTETHFYLPDLRGKTLAGYDENDTAMNTIGRLLGQKTHTHTSAAHTHTTGNHTLTVAEMPAHSHDIINSKNTSVDEGLRGLAGPVSGDQGDWCFQDITDGPGASGSGEFIAKAVGGSQPHNHGNTGSTTPNDTGANTNYQPTITVNWIVKAVMLIPNYIIVEDKLTSDSTVDALSARQGKILNEKFTDYATKSEMIQYLPLKGGTLTGSIKLSESGMETHHDAGFAYDMYGNMTHKRQESSDVFCISSYTNEVDLRYYPETGLLKIPGQIYTNEKKVATTFTKGTIELNSTYVSGMSGLYYYINGNILMIGGAISIGTAIPYRTPFLTIPNVNSSYTGAQFSIIASQAGQVAYRIRATNSGSNIVIDNEDITLPTGWYNMTGFIYLAD